MDPKALFKVSKTKKNIPLFEDLLKEKSEEYFKNLNRKKEWKKRVTPQHAILILSLLGLVLDTPNIAPERFLKLAAEEMRKE